MLLLNFSISVIVYQKSQLFGFDSAFLESSALVLFFFLELSIHIEKNFAINFSSNERLELNRVPIPVILHLGVLEMRILLRT